MSRTDWSTLDSTYTERDVVKLERRLEECSQRGSPFDIEAEIAALRKAGSWPNVELADEPLLTVSWWEPEAWTFWGILKLFGGVALAAFAIGWFWGH